MYENLWNVVLPSLKRMERTCTTPYYWDTKLQSFSVIRRQRYLRYYRLLTHLMNLYMMVICWNILQLLRSDSSPFIKMVSLGVTAVTFAFAKIRNMYGSNTEDIVELLNKSVAFQRSTLQQGVYCYCIVRRSSTLDIYLRCF
jgi:hypothetical protein